jgi:hypothetical protein
MGESLFKTIFKFVFNPAAALIIFTFFMIGYMVFLDEEGAFTGNFLHFGPSTDPKTQTKFLNMKLDTWKKVILMYVVGFCSSILTAYYYAVMDNFIHMYAWNPAVKVIPASKFWSYLTVIISPFLDQALTIVQFFVTLTMQLQFLIPQFIGQFIVYTPYDIYRLTKKKFNPNAKH